jgi:hypothetical protein
MIVWTVRHYNRYRFSQPAGCHNSVQAKIRVDNVRAHPPGRADVTLAFVNNDEPSKAISLHLALRSRRNRRTVVDIMPIGEGPSHC